MTRDTVRLPKLSLKGTPHALWVAERPALRPLPLHVPEVYDVHPRRVDVEGYVNLHRGRYSVDAELIGRQVEVRETMKRIRIYDGHRLVAEHARLPRGDTSRSTLPEHRAHHRLREPPAPRGPEETLLRTTDPSLAALCDRLRVRHGGSALRAIRRLHRLYIDYPTDALVKATRRALDHGLLDLGRLESMVLRVIGGDYFRLPTATTSPPSPSTRRSRVTQRAPRRTNPTPDPSEAATSPETSPPDPPALASTTGPPLTTTNRPDPKATPPAMSTTVSSTSSSSTSSTSPSPRDPGPPSHPAKTPTISTSTSSPTMTASNPDDLDQLLVGLKLPQIRAILGRELAHAEAQGPSYSDFLARLLREEYQSQQIRFMEHRIQRAGLPERWTLDTYPWELQPSIRKAVLFQLASLDFMHRAENLVFIGPTGVGKTGLASAILLKALQAGYRGLFVKAQNLFDDMYRSLADHSSRKLIDRLMKIDLLVIDEMGYLNLRPEQSNIFFKLMEERYGKRSTILTTNLLYDDWYAFLGHKEMVGALLDRMRHRCTTIEIKGPSLRQPTSVASVA